jgi:mitochondrial fission protein ELM1
MATTNETLAAAPPVRAVGRSASVGEPLVWVLADDKLGHTTQSVGLAEAVGWPHVTKELHFKGFNRIVSNRLLGATLVTLDQRRSAPLVPPWPDLVIATGRRTVPVARWIGVQNEGRTRLVQLGRKGADCAEHFDLSVTCSHFSMPQHPRRVETLAPLTSINDRRLQAAAERWKGLFEAQPHPRVALLVGGTSAMHRLDTETAARMGREVAGWVRAAGGSLFVVTSPRTGSSACAALRAAVEPAGRFYEWRRGDPANPYLGCLALADALVVTGDSESMLAEAAATSAPLYIYPLPERSRGLLPRLRVWVSQHAQSRQSRATGPLQRRLRSFCALSIEHGWVRTQRDLSVMHRRLIEAGHARPFGAPLDTERREPLRELDQVAERVQSLLGRSSTAGVD